MASTSPYADGFLLPLPLDKVEAYRLIASQAGAVWMEHGALAYHECVADDLNAPDMVSFTQAAGALPGETVVLAWILFRSRAHCRDAVNAAVMADERLKDMMAGIAALDYRRMAYGGFSPLVSLWSGPPAGVRVEPLDAGRFADLAQLFQAHGCAEARGCWCMFYRHSGSRPVPMGQRLAEVRRREMQVLAGQTPAPGLLAYRGAQAVGWVSLGPRQDFAKLQRSRAMKPVDALPVWSIVCFVVPAAQRGQGLARLLLDAAVQFARQQGAQVLEAYPVDKPAPVDSGPVWFGFEPMFRDAGFVEVARRLPTRPVMRLQLRPPPAPGTGGAAPEP